MKANASTDGAAKQLLLDGYKNAKTPEEKEHYQKQLKVWDKFKGEDGKKKMDIVKKVLCEID